MLFKHLRHAQQQRCFRAGHTGLASDVGADLVPGGHQRHRHAPEFSQGGQKAKAAVGTQGFSRVQGLAKAPIALEDVLYVCAR